MPSVSVVIPSFNRPRSTRAAVLSALRQSVEVSEIIVVDDASPMPLPAEDIEGLDPRVKVQRLAENRGSAGARQCGVDLSQGEVVAFLDSDDEWYPRKLEAQLGLLDMGSPCAVACAWDEVDGRGRPVATRTPVGADTVSAFAGGCWFCPGSTVIVSRRTLDDVGPLDTRLRRLEDYDWFLRFALRGGRLAVSPEVGARIAIGARATTAAVDAARRLVLAKYGDKGELSPTQLRSVRAWLHVEAARAALNEGAYGAMSSHLARSFLLVPRRRVHLERWWKTA